MTRRPAPRAACRQGCRAVTYGFSHTPYVGEVRWCVHGTLLRCRHVEGNPGYRAYWAALTPMRKPIRWRRALRQLAEEMTHA